MCKIDPELLDTNLQRHILQAFDKTGATYMDICDISVPPNISMDMMVHNFRYLEVGGYIEKLQYIGNSMLESERLRFRITPKGMGFLTNHR